MKHILLLAIPLIVISCKAKQQVQEKNDLFEIASKKLGTQLDSFPSSSGKYILFVQKQDNRQSTRMKSALVIEVNTQKILIEESFMPGYIKWIDPTTLELLNAPGMIKVDEDLSGYTKKINLLNLKNHE